MVANSGANTAKDVVLNLELPASFTVNNLSSSQGTVATSVQGVILNTGTLEAGARVTLNVQVTPTKTGSFTSRTEVTSSTSDPDTGNNIAALTLRVAKR